MFDVTLSHLRSKSLVYISHVYLIPMISVQQLNINSNITQEQGGLFSHHRLKVKVHSLNKHINEYRLWVLDESFNSVQNNANIIIKLSLSI